MSDLRAAAQQALEALKKDSPWREETIATLETALVQEEPEPVPAFFYDPIEQKMSVNPAHKIIVIPTTTWRGKIPLYIHADEGSDGTR